MTTTVIEEETNLDNKQASDDNQDDQYVPFPTSSQIFPGFGHKAGKRSNEFGQ